MWILIIVLVLTNVCWFIVATELQQSLRHETRARLNETERANLAENKLAAVDVRDSHYAGLQAANETLNAIVIGMKKRLQTSEQAPFGKFTARFDKFQDLVLFLIFEHKQEG
jgi:hypothetical protein